MTDHSDERGHGDDGTPGGLPALVTVAELLARLGQQSSNPPRRRRAAEDDDAEDDDLASAQNEPREYEPA